MIILKKTSIYGIDPVANPDLQKSGGPVIQILRKGGGPVSKKIIRGGAGPLGPPPVDPPLQSHHPPALGLIQYNFCGRQEEPTNLISRLLLRMRHMYVASIHLGFH